MTTTKSCSTTTTTTTSRCRSSTRTKTMMTRKTRTTTATAFAASSWGAPFQWLWASARGSGRGTSCAARRGRRPCSAAASGRSRARPAAISGRSAAARPSCGRCQTRRRRTRRRLPNHPCSWARSGRPACCGGSGPCRSASFLSSFVGYRSDGVAVWAARHALFAICGLLQRLLRRSRENYFAVSCTRVSARSLRCRVARFSPSSEASGGIDILVLAKELALRHMQAAATPLIARGQK